MWAGCYRGVNQMYLKKVAGPRAVTLPDGSVLTRADLPAPDTQRWVASRKLLVVRAVAHGLLSQAEAQEMYQISAEEFHEWLEAVSRHGEAGLKVTVAKPVDNLR
ncbi:hypothetical protein FIU89_09770 [Roseovarius sp. THAF27]|nr:hypothetical protein FIU89_09770 [Roseovarius sp. THAF27]